MDSQATLEALGLWDRFVTPALGKRATNQFTSASRAKHDTFWVKLVEPNLFRPDLGTYVPLAVTAHVPGRNHLLAETLAADLVPARGVAHQDRDAVAYFTNILKIGKEVTDPFTGEPGWGRPMDRVALGERHVFTFEFDVPGTEFLALQLGWLRSENNALDCNVGALYQRLSQFADFAGITVAFSGNKSLHFHLVFDTGLANATYKLGVANALRKGFMAHWDTLHGVVLGALEVPEGIQADRSLRAPESYRRLMATARSTPISTFLAFRRAPSCPK